jgi:signal transduction histidine kinase
LASGALVGLANVVAAAVGGLEGRMLSSIGTIVLLAAGGWVAGWVADRLRTTATEAAEAQAREEVARTLHDGVLQTLAVIQRRSNDEELVAMAREQDAELRAFLRGDDTTARGSADGAALTVADLLGPRLARLEVHHGIAAHLVVIGPGSARGPAAEALAGAASEAVVNAAKHAGVSDVWVSVDDRRPSGSMVVVHDEGAGFDPGAATKGSGIAVSMRDRVRSVGGGVRIDSSPGNGTDVTLWAP